MLQPTLKLISHKLCPYVQRARIVLEEKSIEHEIEFIELADPPVWFHAISPLGKVPVLLIDGKSLFESAVIAEYLDEITPNSLHPTDSFERARNRSWIEFASSVLDSIAALYNATNQSLFDQRINTLKERFQTLDAAVGEGPYFNGTTFSLVDAAFGPLFRYFDVIEKYTDLDFFTNTPTVANWRYTLSLRDSIRQAVVPDYSERMHRFLLDRNTVISSLILVRSSDRLLKTRQTNV